MVAGNGADWGRRITSFRFSPRRFLSNEGTKEFVEELLQDLKSEKVTEQRKISTLTLFLEFPLLLCPDAESGEQTAEILLDMFSQTPNSAKFLTLKCHLLLAIETLLISTDSFKEDVKAAQELLSLLMQLASDLNDKKQGEALRPLRITACEGLRELESCYPGLLSQKLELLYSMRQQEMTAAHQSYTLLYSVALKNAVQLLAQRGAPTDGALKEMISRNEGFLWHAAENTRGGLSVTGEQFLLLPANGGTKELKSILSLLLEDLYLLTSVSQSSLLWQLIQVVAIIRTLSPVIFKSQLVRLFGTMDISLFHSILQMKGLFTDSLFTAEDESFLLKRLVGMTQHPLLSTPVKLFYIDCLLHFPENRPLNSNTEENLPVLLSVQMTASLFPTVFHDNSTMLSRQNLLSLVYLENEGPETERGMGYLSEHIMSLHAIVLYNTNREFTATFFRTVFLFVRYFNFSETLMEDMIQKILELYRKNAALAPYLINLINQTHKLLNVPSWSIALSKALQSLIVELPFQRLAPPMLHWHLKVLARIAKENAISQNSSIQLLLNIALCTDLCSSGDWKTGNAILSVCKSILRHQQLDAIFAILADLLQYLLLHFEDIDIQERARFYYMLLANLSKDKLTTILSMTSTVGQSKTKTLSSIMSEDENFSSLMTIHATEQPVLQLRRLNDEVCALPVYTGLLSEEFTTGCCLKEYYEQFANSPAPSALTLQYLLAFTNNVRPQDHKLFCIELQFEQSDSSYEPIQVINVPCLFIERQPEVVSLTLEPRLPCPTALSVTATYSTEDGATYQSQLQPLKISFCDIFLPLPLLTAWPLKAQCQLFEELWQSFQPDTADLYAESLFCFSLSQQSLSDFVHNAFARFVVSSHSDVYKIGIFLLPKFHMLMQMKVLDDTASIRIRTDNWEVLPHLSSYLKERIARQ
ncbi:AP-5 complex subunit beta-1 [Microcaecilia unicolor]|uniref:AP-5 complex subunit beta-1 n=1 Tax=Microcaecilia unicolor TaxID=1415580 RepID=A0A6P7ZGD3_9AMPH|nr:AP-5 complex subunit beta-1 [Microcaecilia unicolor]XP_030078396.1 AP-5 complex subunit beta-1 [Microcaecilia unicolor]XP_030078397.1 AP-5 complex subunit beta-1 [Microcaecilia unicolor]XP_030078398.1 AP-5 complex subunit beta-1 [Microcaecilia unicolor]